MFAILISFLYFVSIFFDYFDSLNDSNKNYAIFALSLIFSIASNGLISMLLIATKTLYIPIFFIQILIFFVIVDIKKIKYKLKGFFSVFLADFSNAKVHYGNNFIVIISLIAILLFFTSLGPINHSDAIKYYVGYPFQYYLRNTHFVDGDLGQGLLGIGDFANISFIQEKSIWLIRVSQFLPIVPILIFLGKRKISGLLILIFISSPVIIQWITLGKATFIGDSCLSIVYLCWKNNKILKYSLLTFFVGLISISIKISSLLIFLPIIIEFCFFYKESLITRITNFRKNYQISEIFFLFISIISLLSIFYYRYFLTGNFFFPIFSAIFNQGNAQLRDWEILLRNWDRDGFYQLWLFIPKNPSKIASVLGPATGLFFLTKFSRDIKNKIFKNKFDLNIGFFQLILLFGFAQGRADYYFSPLLILFCGNNNFLNKDKTYSQFSIFAKNNFYKLTFLIQLLLFLCSIFYIIALNFYTLIDYEDAMNRTAYGYFNSKIMSQKAIEPVLSLSSSPPRLFYKSEFVPSHNYWKCYKYSGISNVDDKQKYCVEKLKINTLIVEENYLRDNDNFDCDSTTFKTTPRNIFKSSQNRVDFCKTKTKNNKIKN